MPRAAVVPRGATSRWRGDLIQMLLWPLGALPQAVVAETHEDVTDALLELLWVNLLVTESLFQIAGTSAHSLNHKGHEGHKGTTR
jgi:hypothetical protein